MDAHPFEQFLLTAAREFEDGDVCSVGFHWPMVAARIARRLHAPNLIVIYENGVVEDGLTPELSTSPSDLRAAVGAAVWAGTIDALYGWLGRGRVERTVLEAPIVDRRGNVKASVYGTRIDGVFACGDARTGQSLVVTAIAASTACAVLVTLRALGVEAHARRAAPFLVLTPAAVFMAVSADAMFAAVAAWGIAALALAATTGSRSRLVTWSLVAGLLLGGYVSIAQVVVRAVAWTGESKRNSSSTALLASECSSRKRSSSRG